MFDFNDVTNERELVQNNETKQSLESFLRSYKLPINFRFRKLRGEVLYRTFSLDGSLYLARLENIITSQTRAIEVKPDRPVLELVSNINQVIEELR